MANLKNGSTIGGKTIESQQGAQLKSDKAFEDAKLYIDAATSNHTHALNNLTDVTIGSITAPTTGHTLRYNGTTWLNSYPTLNDNSDMTLISTASGHVLQHDGTKWVNRTLASAGIASSSVTLTGGTGIVTSIGNLSTNRTISLDTTYTDGRYVNKVPITRCEFTRYTSTQTIPSKSWTIITHNVLEANDGGGSFSSGRYTVPQSGNYAVNTYVAYTNTEAGTSYYTAVYRNGIMENKYRLAMKQASGTYDGMLLGSTVIGVFEGDIIDVRTYQASTTSAILNQANIEFKRIGDL